MADNSFIDFLIENDPLGLLKNKADKRHREKNSILLNNFEEIVYFFEEKGREPQNSTVDIKEFQLFCRLKSIRCNANMVKELKDFDLYGLLRGDNISDVPFESILGNDPFNLLSNEYDESIFTLQNVRKSERISPEYIARRKFCQDFDKYKPMFDSLRQDLEEGKRKLAVYRSQELSPNRFYVLGGILVYLKSVEGNVSNYQYNSGERIRYDGRTECIFDNGTTSDMLFRSLDKALQKEGYAITDYEEETQVLHDNITSDDKSCGYVYVLKTHNAKLRCIPDIDKIGSTNSTVTEKNKNALNEPTYLYAGVDIVETFRCYNMGARELEDRLHAFFDNVRLNINIPDERGAIISPREWFCVNISAISEAVNLILSGKIDNYIYDPLSRSIIAKRSSLTSASCVDGKGAMFNGLDLAGATINIGTFHNHPGRTFNDNSVIIPSSYSTKKSE